MKDLYKTLGVPEGADGAAIKAQYKALVKRFHPDANGGDKGAEEQLKLINQAYSTLKQATQGSGR